MGGFKGQCKADVAGGVFMAGKESGFVGQGAEFLQAVPHLGGRAFEQAAAAHDHQTVAREQRVCGGKVKSDVAEGVAGDVKNLHFLAADCDGVSIVQRVGQRRKAVGIGGSTPDAGGSWQACKQVGQAVDMIPMVMGQQNIGQAPAPCGKGDKNRRAFGDIDDGCVTGFRVMDQVGIVVG